MHVGYLISKPAAQHDFCWQNLQYQTNKIQISQQKYKVLYKKSC